MKKTISNNFCNKWATQMILFIWYQHGAVFHIIKNYTGLYVETEQSDEFHDYKLNWFQIKRPQQMIFQ